MLSSFFNGKRSQTAAERKNPLGKLIGSNTIKNIVLNDADRKKRSRERWNLRISASDPEFVKVEARFERALALANPDESVQTVLDRHFTTFEKKLITPVDKRRRPQLYRIQRLNRKRYLQLLRSPRFESRRSTASLPFKLTLLYFGLPIAPMGPGFRDGVEDDVQLDSKSPDNQDDAFVNIVAEDKRPLRFLNAYQSRMWGVDSLRAGEEELEAYYNWPLPKVPDHAKTFGTTESFRGTLNLRGGGQVEEDEDSPMTEDEVNLDENDSQLSLRGGAGEPKTTLMLLYGLQGHTQFDRESPEQFFAAIDRLLGLTFRDVTVTFTLWDKKENRWASELPHLVLDDERRERRYYQDIKEQLFDSDEFDDDKYALFAWTWGSDVHKYLETLEPDPQKHHVALFKLKKAEFDDVAYLAMPRSSEVQIASNHYELWFSSILRIVCRAGEADISATSIGAEGAGLVGRLLRTPFAMSYGLMGFPRQAWETISFAFENDGVNRFTVDMLPVAEVLRNKGEKAFILHGYPKSPVDQSGEPVHGTNPMGLVNLVQESLPPHEWDSANVVEIHGRRGVDTYFLLHDTDEGTAESLKDLTQLMLTSPVLTGRALWKDYEAIASGDASRYFSFRIDVKWKVFEEEVERKIVKHDPKLKHLQRGDYVIQVDERDAEDEEHACNRLAYDFITGKEGTRSEYNELLWGRFTKHLSRPKVYITIFEVAKHSTAMIEANPSQYLFGYQNPIHARPQFEEISIVGEKPTTDPADMDSSDDEPPPLRPIEEVLATIKPFPGMAPLVPPAAAPHAPPAPPAPAQDIEQTNPSSQSAPFPESEEDKANRIRAYKPLVQHKPYGTSPPPRLAAMNEFERGRLAREWSYGRPLSINVEGVAPSFPINAPPVEHIIRTNGSSMPAVAAQLLTATEQRKLQENLFNMRQIALQRTQKCPYDSCEKFFPLAENWRLQEHLKNHHTGKDCPFCSELLYEHWSPAQQRKHFEEKHADHFSQKGDLARDSAISVKSLERVHRREEQYTFCPRCGRNHAILDNKADRTQHDNQCFPGLSIVYNPYSWCVDCGEAITDVNTEGNSLNPGPVPHVCKADQSQLDANAEYPYCKQCGLACGLFSRRYATKHLHHCKGHGEELNQFCPWCGVDMGLRSGERLTHLAGCGQRPDGAEGPLNTATGDHMPNPLLNEDLLRKRFLASKPDSVAIPKKCPLKDCMTDMSFLNAEGIFRHLLDKHANVLGAVDLCPYCELDFGKRGWTTRHEKVAHFNDHLSGYQSRITADIAISEGPETDPTVVAARRNRDADVDRPLKEQLELSEELLRQEVQMDEVLHDLRKANRELRALKQEKADKEKEEREQEKKRKEKKERKEKAKKQQEKKDKGKKGVSGPKTPSPKPPGPEKKSPSTPKPGPSKKPGSGKKPPSKDSKDTAERPKKRKRGNDEGYKPGQSEDSSEDELAEASPVPGPSSGRKNAPKPPATGEKDPTYKPARRPSGDDDDEYEEGLVPEPKPDIGLGVPAEANTVTPPPKKKIRIAIKPPAKAAGKKPAKTATKPPAAPSGRITRATAKKLREEAEKANKGP